jgi:hypothetical protein
VLQSRDVPALLVPSSLSGYVYVDANNNGVFDSGETPVAGVTVTLTGTDYNSASVHETTTTGSTGEYEFGNLNPGTYTITETPPSGYVAGKDTQGTPGTGTVGAGVISDITLNSGVNGTNNNFGELLPPAPTGSVSGEVYVDANKNGTLDAGESGISGVQITLTGPGGTRTMTTDSSGKYSFSDLVAGTYTVTETQPTGYTPGTNTPGTPTDGTVSGNTISGIAVNGTALTGYNFGEIKTATGCSTPTPPSCGTGGQGNGCAPTAPNTCDTGHSAGCSAPTPPSCGTGSPGKDCAPTPTPTPTPTAGCGTYELLTCITPSPSGSCAPSAPVACAPSNLLQNLLAFCETGPAVPSTPASCGTGTQGKSSGSSTGCGSAPASEVCPTPVSGSHTCGTNPVASFWF